MKLIIGGYAQGKLRYALCRYDVNASMVWDGEIPDVISERQETVIINHFHNWVKKRMIEGGHPKKEILQFVENVPDSVIISDEIGNGIVPVEKSEREYRERVGSILIELASRAKEVERVICGIGQRIK